MAYCKKFINGIKNINFSKPEEGLIRHLLLAHAYQELKKELASIESTLSHLPASFPDLPKADEQLARYKEKQNANKTIINAQIAELKLLAPNDFKLDQPLKALTPDDSAKFIDAFAKNFRNIRHLADTLFDAPPAIKALQTHLYLQVLSKLSLEEQEVQFQKGNLTTANIQDMINQAVELYEKSGKDLVLKNQCQRLVQMGIYEMIRRECFKIRPAQAALVAQPPQYRPYQEALASLRNALPNVKKSTILDNLSQFRSSDKKSISDLLAETEALLAIKHQADWDHDAKINMLKERKALFNQLRFGQEDRREYATKIQDNLTRDLFWARNIRDVELFTKPGVSDTVFRGINDKTSLAAFASPNNKEFGPLKTAEQRLESFIAIIKEQSKTTPNIPKGKVTEKSITAPQLQAVKSLVKAGFEQQFTTPTLTITPNTISVEFYYTSISADALTTKIIAVGGGAFGFEPHTLVTLLKKGANKSGGFLDGIEGLRLTGTSLADIEAQITATLKNPDDPKRKAYLKQLSTLKEKAINPANATISSLNLDNSQEILLRKLLELQHISPLKGITDKPAIAAALVLLNQGKFTHAIKTVDLESAIKQAYLDLAEMNPNDASVKSHVKPIIEKSRILDTSTQEREKKIKALEAVFNSDAPTAEQVKNIFVAEYTEMASTLNLPVATITAEIQNMAEEMVRLVKRTKNGEPAISPDEESTYFSIVKQIAAGIKPATMSEVQFKVKHSSTGQQKVKILNATGTLVKTVEVNIPVKLPYSLIKPPTGDFILSYGGSRGVIAPFEGLDETFAKKRMFTNSRLLGVGQYGSVKEVEHLLSGLNQVIKKGYVPTHDETSTFKASSRDNLRTRPISSRDDPLYRIESDVLQNLTRAEKAAKETVSGGTEYWIQDDKPRKDGTLFSKTGTPRQYHILTDRAKGNTYADTANKKLNLYPKGELAYHNPIERDKNKLPDELRDLLKDSIDLSQAIVTEAQAFERLKFAHNDIKPENFLFKKNQDGSYQVKFIDWATGGFSRTLTKNNTTATAVFKELFGADLPHKDAVNECSDTKGRFVVKGPGNNEYTYGINPTLEILHGAHNGTLPYISPEVLQGQSNANTVLKTDASYMDDWALTAMTFGICQKDAYFKLVKGRIVNDYVVPGVLEADDSVPKGLKIVNEQNFDKFFACGPQDQAKTAVMFIPGNQREGEPLHLYRRLQMLQDVLKKLGKGPDSQEQKIINDLNAILNEVRAKVGSGKGYKKTELKTLLDRAQTCFNNYEKLNDLQYQQNQQKTDALQAVFREYEAKPDTFTVNDLLPKVGSISKLEILCTYPATPAQKAKAKDILNKIIDAAQLQNIFLGKNAPGRHLFKACIEAGQEEILNTLIDKVPAGDNPDFIDVVTTNGLLHFSAEQGLTSVFTNLVAALMKVAAKIAELLLTTTYGPGLNQIHTALQIKWSTNSLHIAIRNNSSEQLNVILNQLTNPIAIKAENKQAINQALHLCATLGNKDFFDRIIEKYNSLVPNQADKITPSKILGILSPPDDTSPYHLFLNDKSTLDAIKWNELGHANAALGKKFIFEAPVNTYAFPLLLAANHSNFDGVQQVLSLADDLELNSEQWAQLFKQTDKEGKNLLNYILEQGQLSFLTRFLNLINTKVAPPVVAGAMSVATQPADILVHLLSNPHPINPLLNYLKFEKNEAQQLHIVMQLLNATCSDFTKATAQQQEARIAALLVNKEWLIDKAKLDINHKPLRVLLQNNALSVHYKNILFSKLLNGLPEKSPEKIFFSTLLSEITPKPSQAQPGDIQVALEIAMEQAVLKEVARQTNSIDGLIEALGSNVAGAQALRDQIAALREAHKKLTEELEREKAHHKIALEQVRSTSGLLEGKQKEYAALQHQLDEINAQHKLKIAELEARIGASGADAEKAKKEREDSKTKLDKDISVLRGHLEHLGQQIKAQMEQMSAQATSLTESQAAVKALEQQVHTLKRDNETLTAQLAQNTTLKNADNAELSKLLAEQTALNKSLKTQVTETLRQLKEAQATNDTLQKTADALTQNNQKLTLKITKLDQKVAQLTEDKLQLAANLDKERTQATRTTQELVRTQRLLAEEVEKSTRLQRDIRTAETVHEQALLALNKRISEDRVSAENTLRVTIAQHTTALSGLQSKLQLSNDKVQSLTAQLAEQEKSLTQNKEALTTLQQQIPHLQTRNQELTTELAQNKELAQTKIDQLTRQLAAQTTEHNTLKSEAANTLDQLNAAQQTIAALQKTAADLTKSNALLNENISGLDQRITKLTAEKNVLTEQLKQQDISLKDARSQLESTKDQLTKAQSESTKFREETAGLIAAHDKKVVDLNTIITANKSDATAAREELATEKRKHQLALDGLTQKLQVSEQQSAQLTHELTEQGKRLQTSDTKAKELQRQVDALTAVNTRLTGEVSDSSKLSDSLKAKMAVDLEAQRLALAEAQNTSTTAQSALTQLQSEYDALQTTVKTLRTENAALTTRIAGLEARINQLTAAQDTLTSQLAAKAKDVVDIRSQLQTTSDALKQADALAQRLQTEAQSQIEKHQVEVTALKQTIATGSNQVLQTQQKLDELQRTHKQTLDALNARLKEAEETSASLSTRLDAQAKQLEQSRSETTQFTQKLSELRAENTELQTKLTAANQRTDSVRNDLQGKLDAQLKELTTAQHTAATTLKTLTELQTEHSALQSTAQALKDTNAGLTSEMSSLNTRVKELTESKALLQTQLATKTQEVSTAQSQLQTTADALKTAETALSEQQIRIAALIEANKQKGTALEQTIQRGGADVEDARKQLIAQQTAHEHALKELNARLLESQTERTALASQLKDQGTQLQSSRAEITGLNDQLTALKATHATLLTELTGAKQLVDTTRTQLKTQLESQERDLNTALQSSATTLKTLADLQKTHSALQTQVSALTKDNQALVTQVDSLQKANAAKVQELAAAKATEEAAKAADAASRAELVRLKEVLRQIAENKAIEDFTRLLSKDSHDEVLLNAVAAATTPAHLIAAGLDQALVNLLQQPGIIARLAQIANNRRDANTAALAAIKALIDNNPDRDDLRILVQAKNNDALKIKLPVNHIDALINVNAYQQIVASAQARLAALGADPLIDAEDKAVAALIKTIEHSNNKRLLEHVETATRNEHLELQTNQFEITTLDLKHINALRPGSNAYVQVVAAAQARLREIETARQGHVQGYRTRADYPGTIETLLRDRQARVDTVKTIEDSIKSELRSLANASAVHWFNPGFQAAAKKHAHQMSEHFSELAAGCNEIVKYLVPLRFELQQRIAAIPKGTAPRHKELLERYLQMVEGQLELYAPLYKILNGNPWANHPVLRQGLLKTIEQAKTNQGALKMLAFNNDYTDFPLADKAAHLNPAYRPAPTVVKAHTSIWGNKAGAYDTIDRVRDGQFREHAINNNGRFVEERENRVGANLNDAFKHGTQITISKFPQLNGRNPNALGVKEDLITERVEFSIAAACQLLADLAEPPTHAKPIILQGRDPEEMRYVWTALMIMGANIDDLRFDHHAIQVVGTEFSPKSQLGYIWGFSENSCYETCFKQNMALVHRLIQGIKEASTHSLGDQAARDKAVKDSKRVIMFFKNDLRKLIDDIKDENDNAPGL